MIGEANEQAAIIRTERGLTIAGTRITLYQLMDYIHAGYPPHLIRHQFYISDEQFHTAMSYIEANRAEVEAEYQTVLKDAEEIRQYWEDRNREHFARIAAMPTKPSQEGIRAKLEAWKARIESRA
ncbi:MAG: DUF433 domain-containing protein [Scytonema sp. RU_4_4]|nr:DUF433 domain-containing protein [Scytonema sp. RU_4_4]